MEAGIAVSRFKPRFEQKRMTTRLSRRLLLQTAMASLGTIGQTFRARGATQPRFRMDSGEIDAALQAAVNAADVPGVVAMAATAEAVLYQGASACAT